MCRAPTFALGDTFKLPPTPEETLALGVALLTLVPVVVLVVAPEFALKAGTADFMAGVVLERLELSPND